MSTAEIAVAATPGWPKLRTARCIALKRAPIASAPAPSRQGRSVSAITMPAARLA